MYSFYTKNEIITIMAKKKLYLFFLLLTSTPVYAELPEVVLNDTNAPPYTTSKHDGYLDRIATEAFRRVGYKLRLVQLPSERGLMDANNAVIDGDLTRIEGLENQYPGLVRIPERIMNWKFAAFGKKGQRIDSWKDIVNKRVGLIRGWKIYESKLKEENARSIISTNDAQHLFSLLMLDRIDVALYERQLGLEIIKKEKLTDFEPKEPLLAKRHMYIYLNKRHAKLVPRLAAVLASMKKEGIYRPE